MIEDFFQLLSGFGYLGIFLISLIGSSTVIFPLPAAAFVFGAALVLNPFAVGVIAGFGAALGELVGYLFGFAGRKIGGEHIKTKLDRAREIFKRYGGFLALIIFAATPMPDDLAGILSGMLKYEPKKFFIAVLIGKIIFHLTLAYAAFYGINGFLKYFLKY
jgi:membrane protein YqaA with SNARE-associated domain